MTNKKKGWLIAGIIVAVLVIAAVLVLLFAGGKTPVQDPTVGNETVTYTVEVKSAGGMALPGVGIYIYEDETLAELVWFDQTGEDGTMTFTDLARDTYVAVLSDVPTGYAVEEFYPITGEKTEIILAAGQLDPENVGDVTYKLGDMMMDFTVLGPDGTEYTLSELLQQKKAVVLNFWYIECGPCNAEFPYLQEAYEKYADKIALIAMNPINTESDIAAFQQEKGYTFPMVSCGSEWEKLMGITAYPTTVVIDRFGNICLIHRGSIDNAKTFEDTFAYFAADEYEQKIIDDITTLVTEAEEGTAENPKEVGGQSNFEIVVEPGKEVYTELYKAKGMYMSIKGENSDFYVLYNDKKYTPDSSGKVGFIISTGDNYTPALFGIGNTGTETQTFSVTLSHLAGTFNNPYSLKLGEFTAKVSGGNDQGVYYRGTAPEDGTFTVQCISSPAGVEYDFFLQSLDVNRTVLRNYRGDGSVDEETGYPTVSLPMKKGTDIMFAVGTLPDDSNSYPGGSFRFLVTFTPGEVEDVTKVEKIDYTVTVTDENDQPLKDITVWLTKDSETVSAKTDENGIVTLNLAKGTYTGTVSLPEGYTLENNAFELTEEAPATTVKLSAAVDTRVDYTVTVADPEGNPVEGAQVLILGAGSHVTGADGTVTVKLEPGTYSAMTGTLPAGFTCGEMLTLTAETLSGTITLEYIPGTHPSNPIMLLETDNTVTNAGTVYYGAQFSGTTMQIIGAPGFTVLLDGNTLADTDGVVSQDVYSDNPRMPIIFAITGDGDYYVTFTYPEGHQMNPAAMVLGHNAVTQAAGAADYYYNWTAIGDGELTITMDAAAQWVYSLSNQTSGVSCDTHWSDDEIPVVSQTIAVSAGDVIQLTVNTYDPANMFLNPAGEVAFDASFLWVIDEVPFTTAAIDDGSSYTYRVAGINGATLTIADADAYVIYGSTTYGADSTGKVIVNMGAEDPATLVIGNCGTETESYEVNFTWPKGSLRNPDVKTFRPSITFSATMQAGDTDGYYFATNPTQTGTLTITVMNNTANYTIEMIRNGGEEVVTPAAGSKTMSMYVVPGDVILLHVQAATDSTGAYPACTVVSRGTFQVDYATYTVTFDANGGTLTGAASADTTNGKLAALPADPVRQGWKFLGWFDAAEGGSRITTSTAIKANMTAYAQWEKIEHTITFNPGAGALTGEASAVTTDWKLTALPADPVLDGYTFNGWFDLPAGGNAITTDTVFTANTEIYAQWTGSGSSEGQTLTYEVTVIDGKGLPVTGGVYVTWQGAAGMDTKVINNASGTAAATLPVGTYSIVLTLTGDYKDYHYDTATAVVTAEKTAITIQIALPISDTAPETDYSTGGGDLVTKDVELGATYVELNSSQSNYAVMDGKAYCFFRFQITEEGKYAFTTNNGAPISNWGSNTSFLYDGTTEEERVANKFIVEIKEDNFSSEEHVLSQIFAVEVTDGYTDTILQVSDAGDAEYTYLDAPFVVYEGAQTPEVAFENGKPVAIAENIFQLTTGGKTLTYVDMLTDQAVKGEDGYYHLNSEDGPILYVNLGADAPYISLGTMVGAIGQYGTSFKKIFYNADGTPEINADGTYHKEDYTDAMVAYALHMDSTTGVYPLNDDLIYMIQNGGEFKGWYTPGSGTYLFEEKDIEVDPELIWMFAVCYLK